MPTALQFRRGTTAQNNSFTGSAGELTVDTQIGTLRVHDGSTAGGNELMKIDGSNADTTVSISGTLTATTVDINGGAIDGTAIGANSASTGQFTNVTITGNLTVNGTTTTVSSTNTTISDNLLELNSGAATNANDAGILIERGSTGDNAIIAWDESADQFIVGTTTATNTSTGDLTITAAKLTVATPTAATDAATKGYVDGELSSLSSNSISEGDTSIIVGDGGVGAVTITVDNTTHSTFNSSGIVLSQGTFQGTSTSAQYADLAENYNSDADYAPGTVVILGGDAEVTQCTSYADHRVAGVVSSNPAYLMNSDQQGEHVVAVALTGRVPCRVKGTIRKGDLLVTGSTPGVAQKLTGEYNPGTIIGKAIEAHEGANEGIIEVLVGRN